jgi:hypothetical protein
MHTHDSKHDSNVRQSNTLPWSQLHQQVGTKLLTSSGRLEVHRAYDLISDTSELFALCELGPKLLEDVSSWTPFETSVN